MKKSNSLFPTNLTPSPVWLLPIVVLAFMIRFINVSDLPMILNRDEAALGYNALLLAQSGHDEWQRPWPLVLESFGDFKLPGYVWSIMAVSSLIGYSDLAVRLPSVLAGTALVALAFAFARRTGFSVGYSLLLALVVAVLPVFVFFSRMGFEANLGLALLVSMLCLIFEPIIKGKRQWLSDALLIGLALLAMFTYNTPFLLLPFLIPLLPIIRGWKSNRWWVTAAGLVVVWIAAAVVLFPLTQQKGGITIFSDPLVYTQYVEYRQQLAPALVPVVGSKYVYWLGLMGQRLLASWSPSFLVMKGGSHPWHQVPGTGHLYWSVYLAGLAGVVWSVVAVINSFKRRHWPKTELLMIYLLLISLLPAVVTVDAPHATRSLLFFLMLSWFVVYGLQQLKRNIAQIGVGVFLFVLVIESGAYLWRYATWYPQHQAGLNAGFDRQLPQALASGHTTDPTQVPVVIDSGGYQYILTAWYLKLPANEFFATIQRAPKDTIGFSYGQQVGPIRLYRDLEAAREAGAKRAVVWNEITSIWETIELQ